MKRYVKRMIAFLLVLILSVQLGEIALAATAEEIRVALDPTSQIQLSVPTDLTEGNWFFIRERQFVISEKSSEKLYVPIQRAGDLSEAADVTLKLADITSHFGVNYKAEIYRVKQAPAAEMGEFSLVDAIYENQLTLEESPELSEEEMEELIARQGEVEITDAAGNLLGTASVEDGGAGGAGETLMLIPEEIEPFAEEGAAPAPERPCLNPLQAARNAFTGTVSDRQVLRSDVSWMSPGLQKLYDDGDDSLPPAEQEEDLPNSIPGYLFTLDYAPGENVKFLVLTPLYSAKADGDSSLLLTLEAPSSGFLLNEEFFTSYVMIKDEDEPEQVTVSFSQAEYTAENGKAILTVTRQGAINEIVTVQVATFDGSAAQGEDYSGVGAKLYFPMGLESRTLEIPVSHGTEEKDFYVTLTPVSECTAGLGTARVVIPAAEGDGELMLDDRYLDEPFPDVLSNNGATVDGTGGSFSTSEKEREQVGLNVEYPWGNNSFFYDGVRINWSADIPMNFFGHIKITAVSQIPGQWSKEDLISEEVYHLDANTISSTITNLNPFDSHSFEETDLDYYFGREENPVEYRIFGYEVYNSLFASPAKITLHSVTPIKREFKFEVLPADPLGLRGVPVDDEKQLNGVYINSSLTDASVTVLSNGTFALTAQNVSEFSRFAGIDAVAPDGSTMRIASASPGTRTINVEVTESMINALANSGYITWTDNRGIDERSKLGVIQIKPIFEKIPATVRVDEGAYGYFEGFEGGGEYQYYLGERITLKTALNERGEAARVRGSGIGYIKADGKEGVRLDQSNDSPYLNTAMTKVFLIDQPYTVLWPIFDTQGNAVTLQVKGADLQYFDTSRGVFTMDESPNYNPETDVYTYYLADNATVNQVMLLAAAVAEGPRNVPLWKDGRSDDWYCGNLFPIRVGTSAAENVITLSIHTDSLRQVKVVPSGTVGAQEINLATGRPGGRVGKAAEALVYFGSGSGLSGGEGEFTLPATSLASGYAVRYAVSYNGALTIRETRAPDFDFEAIILQAENDPDTDWEAFWEKYVDTETFESKPIPMDLGLVEIPSFSTLGAHITNVYAIQDHHYMSDVKILEMNGQNTVLAARVSSGEGYMLDGELRQENVLGVTFYFMNPLTNELHGVFETEYDEETDTWRVDLEAFTPNRPDDFTYGDVLYAQLTTDKQIAAAYDAESGIEAAMCYDPVSTGYAVISDADYKPILFDWDMPVDAENMLGPGGVIEQAGGDPEQWDAPYDESVLNSVTRTTYGEFPFIGELNFILKVKGFVSKASNKRAERLLNSMLNESTSSIDSDGDLTGDDGELMHFLDGKQVRMGIAMKFTSLPYGGTRFAFAVTFTVGNDTWDKHMSNPWVDSGAAAKFFKSSNPEMRASEKSFKAPGFKRQTNGFLGVAALSLTFAIGFYLDFGYINITEIDDSGHSTVTHDCVFLGGGGLGGFIGTLSTTGPLPTPIPMYAGLEVEASIMFFLGSGRNPRLALSAFRNQTELDGLDYGFTYQVTGSVSGVGVLGVGFDHALGLRGNLGVKVEVCYSTTFEKWFPENQFFKGRPFSWGSSLIMSGYLDAVFMNIPLATFSYPLENRGYLYLFNEMRVANRLVSMVQENINELLDAGKGDPGVIGQCTDYCKRILDQISRFTSPAQNADKLREYAYKNGIISSFEYALSFSAEVGGLAGMAMRLLDDGGEAAAPTWTVQPHASSQWVAGDSAELMAAFSPVASTTVVADSREQTNARLMDIGDGRLLMVFLDDDPDRSETHASILKYAVYNSETGVWEIKPTVVQADGTGDYMPDLCDAEDDVILSWISTAPDKLVQSGDDPTNEMDMMDVFSLRLPKAGLKSESAGINEGDIYQVTDDTVYDSMPRAVFDRESKDVLLLYTKTMPDTDYEPGSVTQKVLDYTVGGEKVYSVNAYMLYDAAKGDWAKDYFYENESSFDDAAEEADFLKKWGGQRFVRIKIDGRSDPAIAEMAVSIGYNGLAAYAYTVDKDYDLSTASDRELYLQFYDFRDHKTYVPIRLTYDSVSQAMPTLTRTEGDTYLFWMEDNIELKYLNVSSMLRSYAEDADGEKIYAVQSNGSFAEGYEPPICTLDMNSVSNTDGIEGLTGYTVLSNESTLSNGATYDDLYVVWTSGETYEAEIPGLHTGETRTAACKEIYASAFIHEDDRELAGDGMAEASWSKPYRLTEDHKYHDGVAAAIDSKGDLILLHNEFDMIWHGDDEEWISTHLSKGVDQNGETYLEGDCYEYTPTNLVMTRCIPVGSLEVSELTVSDETPLPGETVKVTAVLENAGLTTARGTEVKFYETKNGRRGKLLCSVTSDDKIVVNTGKLVVFDWELPASLKGVGVECVVSERNPRNDGYFDPVSTEYTPLKLTPEPAGEILSITQKGDVFEAEVSVANDGNLAVEEGTEARLYLECLYGNASEVYGVDDKFLAAVDLSGLKPGAEKREIVTLEIPASVFNYCGYDAVTLLVYSPEMEELSKCEPFFVCLDEPMELTLCGGKDKEMTAGQVADLDLSYILSPFRDENTSVVYTSADPSVAAIIDGKLVAVNSGTTTVTATLLPFGSSAEIRVSVTGIEPEPEPEPDPGTELPGGKIHPRVPETDTVVVTDKQVDRAGKTAADGTMRLDFSDERSSIVTAKFSAEQAQELAAIAAESAGDLVIALPAGTVTLDAKTLGEIAGVGEDFTVTVKNEGSGNFTVQLNVESGAFDAVVGVALPAAGDGQVLVSILPDGTRQIIKKSFVEDGRIYARIPAGATVRVVDNKKSFPDVADGAWYKTAVDFVSSHELFQGTDKGFEPDAPMTRAMLATVLFRLEDGAAEGENPFADVPDDAWYADAAIWAGENGIVKGTDRGFEPNVNVTREQIATMLYRYVKYLGLDVSEAASLEDFPDGGEVSDWAREAMRWAVGVGLFRGDETGALNPRKNATRAEVATLMERVVKLIAA